MNRFTVVLAATGLLAGALSAQGQGPPAAGAAAAGNSPWRVSASVGTTFSASPLVFVSDGSEASVNQTSATQISLDLERRLGRGIFLFVSGTLWAPQLTHSGILEVDPYPSRPVYQATTVLTSFGLNWMPERRLLWVGSPVLRAGVAYKIRKLDVPYSDLSADLAGDIGAGWRTPISDRADLLMLYRFSPSEFNPATLPIVLGGEAKQAVNDHFVQLGVRWTP